MHNIFQKIINRELPAEIIYEDERVIAIFDKFPSQPGHFLVIPKKYSESFKTIEHEDMIYLFTKAIELANKRMHEGLYDDYKIITNAGHAAGQVINHTHIHVIPYKR